jgi:hypothetical protein
MKAIHPGLSVSKSRSARKLHEKVVQAGCWWLMLVILATQEAEIRRIAV